MTLASVVGVIDGADWCCPCDAGGAGGGQEVLVVELVGAVGWWWLMASMGVGCPVMCTARCGASVSRLVMRYRVVASWMVLGDSRWEKKCMA